MSKFRVGQTVIIKELVDGQPVSTVDNTTLVVDDMLEYSGKVAKITRLYGRDGQEKYLLDSTDEFIFGDNIIEPAFKIGTKVKVKETMSENFMAFERIYFVQSMLEYRGREATIVSDDTNYNNCFKLDIDNRRWAWSEDFLDYISSPTAQPIVDTTVDEFKVGDVIEIINNEEYKGEMGYITKKINSVKYLTSITSYRDFSPNEMKKVTQEYIDNLPVLEVPILPVYEQVYTDNSNIPVNNVIFMPTRKTTGMSIFNSTDYYNLLSTKMSFVRARKLSPANSTIKVGTGTYKIEDVEVIKTNFVQGEIENGHRIKDECGKTHSFSKFDSNIHTLVEDNEDYISYIDATGWFITVWKALVTKPRGTVQYTEYFALCPDCYAPFKAKYETRNNYLSVLLKYIEAKKANKKTDNIKSSYRNIKNRAEQLLADLRRKEEEQRTRAERERITREEMKYGIWKHHNNIWN